MTRRKKRLLTRTAIYFLIGAAIFILGVIAGSCHKETEEDEPEDGYYLTL